ncbi:hypothetical protein K7W03_27295 [Sphingobium sp. PNB]|uniref:hypothetical protein n=1 Tax=Sphingobium sp. PNB TaxID=863934 RepID=UPI001CA44D96|nr:hypothetical protein [Sphingobium sp. PNB]MCB4863282.1 hypothetical protein [Sphingobium sp. PNB]
MDYDLCSFRGDSGTNYFKYVLENRQADLKKLEDELLSVLAGSPDYFRTVYKNPRLNSTSLGHRELVLKRNVVNNLDKYKKAAVAANEIYLALYADMTELKFVMEAREKNKEQIDTRYKSAGLYEGSREFIESMFDEHGITTYKLSTLDADDRAVIADTIKNLLSRHLSND